MRRRIFLHSATAALVLAACGGSSEPDCESPAGLTDAQRTQRTALHYRDRANDRARNCSTCNFFAAGAANACGSCSLGLGAVSPAGVCDGFAARA